MSERDPQTTVQELGIDKTYSVMGITYTGELATGVPLILMFNHGGLLSLPIEPVLDVDLTSGNRFPIYSEADVNRRSIADAARSTTYRHLTGPLGFNTAEKITRDWPRRITAFENQKLTRHLFWAQVLSQGTLYGKVKYEHLEWLNLRELINSLAETKFRKGHFKMLQLVIEELTHYGYLQKNQDKK